MLNPRFMQKISELRRDEVDKIIRVNESEDGNLISLLQKVQVKYNYLPPDVLYYISEKLKVPPAEVYGVATFYAQFRFNKPGKHQIKVCQGTACHVRGGKRIMGEIEKELHITHGETTEDGQFSIEKVACMGCCALAPVMVENDTVYGTCTPAKARMVINDSKAED